MDWYLVWKGSSEVDGLHLCPLANCCSRVRSISLRGTSQSWEPAFRRAPEQGPGNQGGRLGYIDICAVIGFQQQSLQHKDLRLSQAANRARHTHSSAKRRSCLLSLHPRKGLADVVDQ